MLKLYNTLTRQLEDFKPLKRGQVGLYTCGPTVYNYAHIGNLRTFVFEDILKRALTYNGYKVKHVMNITDVGHLTSDADQGEDKMEKGSKREGKTAWEIADFYTNAFLRDLNGLNILPATLYPRATDHIPEQIKLIKKLGKKGFVYQTQDGVYFDTSKLSDYGKLANLKNQELKAGVRVDIGDKKNITDFALWKLSEPLTNRQMEWDSPWGKGFPGWHLECSAMSVKYLGQPFDIHSGGIDHIPVHHTNEIAQSEAAEGKPLANYWLHGEFLLTGEAEKMAKSGDNFITLESLKKHRVSPLAYRFFLLQTHYRKQLTFSWDALEAAQTGLNHLYQIARSLTPSPERNRSLTTPPFKEGAGGGQSPITEQFLNHLNNDLDTPSALALIWQSIKEKTLTQKLLLNFDRVLGLKISEALIALPEKLPDYVEKIITDRNRARAVKDWAKSDELRVKLEAMGYEVKDTGGGTQVTKK